MFNILAVDWFFVGTGSATIIYSVQNSNLHYERHVSLLQQLWFKAAGRKKMPIFVEKNKIKKTPTAAVLQSLFTRQKNQTFLFFF